MTLAECAELKKRLVAEKDLSQVESYFYSNFVERGPFMSMGRPLDKERSDKLVKTLSAVFTRISTEVLLQLEVQFVEIPEYQLIHGSVDVNGRQGSVLYFEDLGVGLFTLVWSPRTGETKFLRFFTAKREPAKPN